MCAHISMCLSSQVEVTGQFAQVISLLPPHGLHSQVIRLGTGTFTQRVIWLAPNLKFKFQAGYSLV